MRRRCSPGVEAAGQPRSLVGAWPSRTSKAASRKYLMALGIWRMVFRNPAAIRKGSSTTTIPLRLLRTSTTFWGYDTADGLYDAYLGHCPRDSELGLNFSVFARPKIVSESVAGSVPSSCASLEVLLDPGTNSATASYNLLSPLRNAQIEVFDDLGRLVATLSHVSANPGWNEMPLPVNSLASGVYLCRLSGSELSLAKSFSIVK